MVFQTQSNGLIAYKVQSALGSPESGSGATVLRTAGGPGGRLSKSPIESNEVRSDGQRSRGRHGSRATGGSYECEYSLGAMDPILEAVMRGSWSAANLELDEADFTSITTGANTIVAAAGSWISLGLRVGDVIRLTDHSSTGNNGRNLRITALSASTITVAETLTVNAVADTDCAVTRVGRSLIQPAAGSLVKRYFTIEENEGDIDASEVFSDAVWHGMRFSMQPNGLLMATPTFTGTGKMDAESAGDAPVFSSPTEPTGVPMSVVDATVRLGSTDLVDLTGFEITMDIGANAPALVASHYAPDVFTGQMAVSMSLSMLRKDLAEVARFLDETVLSLHVLAVDNESEPKDFLSIYVPNFTFGSVDKSALSREAGPRTQTMEVPAALVGKDTTGGAYDPTMVKIQVSNAS